MIAYFDSSALLKRVLEERETSALEDAIAVMVRTHDLQASALVDVEVSRALRRRIDRELDPRMLHRALDDAIGDIDLVPIDAEVIRTARVIGPPVLRSLDAIHLATAILIGADFIVTYDERMAEAASVLGIGVESPGS